MKRYYYKNKDYIIDYDKRVVVINRDLHEKLLNKQCVYPGTAIKYGYKKIGGSTIGNILKATAFSSDFNAFCGYAYLAPKPLVMKYINAGIAVEPKVIKLLDEFLNKNRKENEKVIVSGTNAKDYNYDYFSGHDTLINGVPDGFITLPNKSQVLLEIKTAGEKKFAEWKRNVPKNYIKQAQLYAYILGIKKFWIVTSFLKESDYAEPEEIPVHNRILKNFMFVVNESEAKDDMEYAKEWYKKYIHNGVSPEFNRTKDAELLEYLECENEEQWQALINKWKKEGECDQDYEG
ncbi:YqaJ-like viral recombinase domain [Mycoplasmopsis californica]|uniref:YqaJ viral recombinase domain-containing protein n=1 Tax=Mycoplasmopsis equigenitalium TaxID=114883 RepID=A0ABY5J0Z0_9BACT|nr:hypothetical protein [Mycoplasmopsis equigenitalium]UUD36920.1 hypothetical protein NPA09_03410 [Mycoplasmopsis equigenitalium]VEU69785.1 YqaJ-like viral recombinase domain [Mycoplasmopsis californica]